MHVLIIILILNFSFLSLQAHAEGHNNEIKRDISILCSSVAHDDFYKCATRQRRALAEIESLMNNVEPQAGDQTVRAVPLPTILECLEAHTLSDLDVIDYETSIHCVRSYAVASLSSD